MGIKIISGQLCQWNVHKSVGSDGIHLRILKNLVDVIMELLSIIHQRYWEPGEVSAGWKIATVISIYKRGVREDQGNRRSISLTSNPGKVMEKIVFGNIGRHCIIKYSQHGFIKRKSCLSSFISYCKLIAYG